MAANWQLRWMVAGHETSVDVSEFESVIYRQLNANSWELKITRGADSDAPAYWDYDAPVSLVDGDGNVRFAGKILQPSTGEETAASRKQLIAVSDGWHDLTRKTYLQDYPYDTYAGKTPKVLIGGKWQRADVTDPLDESTEGAFETVIDLVPQDIALTLADAVEQMGYDEAHRDIQLSATIPPHEGEDMTVEAVIKSAMKWFPGSVAWVEPSTGVLHARRASELPTISIDASQILGVPQIEERPDLVLPGASLYVRKTKKATGDQGKEYVYVYTAGDPTALGALAASIELTPEEHVLDIGYLEIIPFGGIGQELIDVNWWAKFVPWMQTALQKPDDYRITALIGPNLTFGGAVFDTSLTHIIDRGTIKDSWLIYGCAGPVAIREPFITTDNMTVQVPKIAPVSATCKVSFEERLPNNDWLAYNQSVSVPLFLTGLTASGKYAWEDKAGYVAGEDPAMCAGLPELFVTETQKLLYQGRIKVAFDELPGTLIGTALNLTGFSNASWATMAAPIHTATYDVNARTVEIEFGSAGYLGLKDLAEQMRAVKHKRPQRHRHTKYGLPPPPSLEGAGQQGGGTPPPAKGTQGQAPFPPPSPDLGPFVGVGTAPGKILVGASTLNGDVPTGFNMGNTPPYQIDAPGSGYFYVQGTIDTTTGAVTGMTLHTGTSVPADAGANAYYKIFSWAPDPDNVDPTTGLALPKVAQLCYGPITFKACWVGWSNPPVFTPDWQTGGGAGG